MHLLKQFLRRVIGFLFTVNIEKHIKKYDTKKYNTREEICFVEGSPLRDHMGGAAYIFSYLTYIVFLMMLVCIVLMFIDFPDEFIQLSNEMRMAIIACVGIFLFHQIMKLTVLVFAHNKTAYCKTYLRIDKFGYKEKIISYEELGQCIREKGIRVKSGALMLPFRSGETPIYIHDNEKDPQKEMLIEFINERCGVEIPLLSKEEKRLIRRTGICPTFMKVFVCMLIVDFFIVLLGSVSEGNYSLINAYAFGSLKEFCSTHLFLVMGLPIGIWGIFAGVNSALDLSELSKYDIFRG